jgi:predicted aldo/keto reductase-like oxidoreductase
MSDLMEPEDVKWCINDSVEKLGLDYMDCFLIHMSCACEGTEEHGYKLDADGKVSFQPLLR